MSGNRNASIRRLQQELRDLSNDTEYNYEVVPIDDNIFEWHFSIQGAPDSVYEGGIYHGKIIFPTEYPFKPPDIIILTVNLYYYAYNLIHQLHFYCLFS